MAILTLNAGSSSLKFAVFSPDDLTLSAEGQVERIGADARLIVKRGGEKDTVEIGETTHASALARIIDVLNLSHVHAVGHRIVHGGTTFTGPAVLSHQVLEQLKSFEPFAPLHQPHNLAGVSAAHEHFPDALQVGAFDTAFHRGHPWVHDTFALPRRLYDQGVRRYGFHGLSYDYISGHLTETRPQLAAGRVIVAHLGNGASLCAIENGQSISSTMSFSALDGLAMGTRCGQLDPGVMLYLMEQMTPTEISDLLYKESGLKGLSGIGSDMRTLLASDAPEAAEAVAYFVARICHEIGALAADLGGVDGLVFTGGIGENAAAIRSRIVASLHFLGFEIDTAANEASTAEINSGDKPVLVLNTNEELVIARAARDLFAQSAD